MPTELLKLFDISIHALRKESDHTAHFVSSL